MTPPTKTTGNADEHLHNAMAYARQLDFERAAITADHQAIVPGNPLPRELAAAQGEAMRLTIVECSRAIVAAIRESGDAHAREVARVRASLQLADSPEDRHGTYARRSSRDALRHDTSRTVAERRREWLHTHAGEPLPPELQEVPDAGAS